MGRGIPVDGFGRTNVADGRAGGGISGGGGIGDNLSGIAGTGDGREGPGGANSGFVGGDEGDDADKDSGGGVAWGERCGIVDEDLECVVFVIRPRSF